MVSISLDLICSVLTKEWPIALGMMNKITGCVQSTLYLIPNIAVEMPQNRITATYAEVTKIISTNTAEALEAISCNLLANRTTEVNFNVVNTKFH